VDNLWLLTTHWRPIEKLLTVSGETSAAAAQAARMAAILRAARDEEMGQGSQGDEGDWFLCPRHTGGHLI